MLESALTSISPIDGRYHKQTKLLGNYFSEFALIRYRVWVEIEYFIALAELPLPQLEAKLSDEHKVSLRAIYQNFNLVQAERIKEIERTTNHDVKAVEYFLKEEMERIGLAESSE
ncbi:MAG: adenylosuccinate lyase, partial [Bacteroidia bacterium]|nr:adenylosuccinate lyase [Bacteroidia bacterium]